MRILLPLVVALCALPSIANPHVVIETNHGEIEIELFEKEAPLTVANFLKYVDDGYYAGTIFHRVIGNFMIQGGGFDRNLVQKTTRAPVKNEATNRIANKRGTIAMARTGVVDSATSQFFINVKDNASLNHTGMDTRSFGYTVFGKVVRGMEVVDKIKAVKTGACMPNFRTDCPVSQVVMERIRRATDNPLKAPTLKTGGPVTQPTGGW